MEHKTAFFSHGSTSRDIEIQIEEIAGDLFVARSVQLPGLMVVENSVDGALESLPRSIVKLFQLQYQVSVHVEFLRRHDVGHDLAKAHLASVALREQMGAAKPSERISGQI